MSEVYTSIDKKMIKGEGDYALNLLSIIVLSLNLSCKAQNLLDNKKAMLRSMESKVGVGISYLLEENGNVDFFRIYYVCNITTL